MITAALPNKTRRCSRPARLPMIRPWPLRPDTSRWPRQPPMALGYALSASSDTRGKLDCRLGRVQQRSQVVEATSSQHICESSTDGISPPAADGEAPGCQEASEPTRCGHGERALRKRPPRQPDQPDPATRSVAGGASFRPYSTRHRAEGGAEPLSTSQRLNSVTNPAGSQA